MNLVDYGIRTMFAEYIERYHREGYRANNDSIVIDMKRAREELLKKYRCESVNILKINKEILWDIKSSGRMYTYKYHLNNKKAMLCGVKNYAAFKT